MDKQKELTNKALNAIGELFMDKDISDEDVKTALEHIKSEVEVYLEELPKGRGE